MQSCAWSVPAERAAMDDADGVGADTPPGPLQAAAAIASAKTTSARTKFEHDAIIATSSSSSRKASRRDPAVDGLYTICQTVSSAALTRARPRVYNQRHGRLRSARARAIRRAPEHARTHRRR